MTYFLFFFTQNHWELTIQHEVYCIKNYYKIMAIIPYAVQYILVSSLFYI